MKTNNDYWTDLFGNKHQRDVLLRDRFVEPPFSVLDTKSGNWQNRKRLWKTKGIRSELGRKGNLTYSKTAADFDYYRVKEGKKEKSDTQSTSIFDPALCELMYRWFCPDAGRILDPFAGGSVRGIVAHYLGYCYTGIELRSEQVDANIENALDVLPEDNQPLWYAGDSESVLDTISNQFDMIFSCPPYMDLEKYSDDKNDLSNMTIGGFIEKYSMIIKKSSQRLKKHGSAVFVVGEVRDKKTGFYKDFLGITKKAFRDAGMLLYNDIVLLNHIASASMRAGKVFEAGGKITKVHQNILVFKHEG